MMFGQNKQPILRPFSQFKLGDKVEVKWKKDAPWISGVFIAVHEGNYIVKVNRAGYFPYPFCRYAVKKHGVIRNEKNKQELATL